MSESEYINGYTKEEFVAWQLAMHGNPHTGEPPNPYYFLKYFVYTFDEYAADRGLNPYRRFPIDKEYLRRVLDYINRRGDFVGDYYQTNELLIEKSRQITITWIILEQLLYWLISKPGVRAASIAQKGEKTQDHAGRMWHTITQFRGSPHVAGTGTAKENTYIAELPDGRYVFKKSGGDIEITHPNMIQSNFHGFTSNFSEARGYTLNYVYIDEPPHVPNAIKVYKAVSPTVRSSNGLLIISGSPEGRDPLLYAKCHGELEAA